MGWGPFGGVAYCLQGNSKCSICFLKSSRETCCKYNDYFRAEIFYFFFSGPPEIESDYLERYVAQEGDTVKLLCPIIGTPKPIIEWYQVRVESLFRK